jgi:hypothetical protein
MDKVDRIQRQRFEYKYMISEEVALGVRDFVSSYLSLDEFSSVQADYSYPVHSLYLDSPDLVLYQNTINGDKNRFKLRLRFYETGADKPVYLEIKRRLNNTIRKQRAAVRREDVANLIAGYVPEERHLAAEVPGAMDALESFVTLVHRLRATPRSHVSYQREAWVDEGANSVRITLDRNVRSEPRQTLSFDPWMLHPTDVFGRAVVLELKFTDRFPKWFNHLVQSFGLVQGAAAKYVDGIGRMSERGLLYVGF